LTIAKHCWLPLVAAGNIKAQPQQQHVQKTTAATPFAIVFCNPLYCLYYLAIEIGKRNETRQQQQQFVGSLMC